MLAELRRSQDIKLFQRNYAVDPGLSGQQTGEMDKQIRTCIVGQGDEFVQAFAWPCFAEHLFFGDQDDLSAVAFALVNEINAFEIGGETDDV